METLYEIVTKNNLQRTVHILFLYCIISRFSQAQGNNLKNIPKINLTFSEINLNLDTFCTC